MLEVISASCIADVMTNGTQTMCMLMGSICKLILKDQLYAHQKLNSKTLRPDEGG